MEKKKTASEITISIYGRTSCTSYCTEKTRVSEMKQQQRLVGSRYIYFTQLPRTKWPILVDISGIKCGDVRNNHNYEF